MTTSVHYDQIKDINAAQIPDATSILAGSQVMHRPSFAHVQIDLKENECVIADGGAMLWMDGNVKMYTDCHHGICAGFWRTCSSESCCNNKFTGPGQVAFGFDLPGDILPFAVSAQKGWLFSGGAYICSTPNVQISSRFSGCGVCCCGNEGMFLTHASSSDGNTGLIWAGDYGAIQRHDVPPGRTFIVDAGLFFACTEDVQISIGLAGGCYTCCCGGEGFVMKFRGPCSVYTQNRDPAEIMKLLKPPVQMDWGQVAQGIAEGVASGS